MHRLSYVVALVGLLVAGFALGSRQPGTTAQEASQPPIVGAWFVTIALHRAADRCGLLRHAWHPALLVFAVYVIVLSSWILVVPRLSSS